MTISEGLGWKKPPAAPRAMRAAARLAVAASLLAAAASTLLCFGSAAASECRGPCIERPQWEVGAAVAGGVTPHYTGSNHVYKLALPLPTFRYRFDFAKLGQDFQLVLARRGGLLIDAAFSGRLPVESAGGREDPPPGAEDPRAELPLLKNHTRRGMPDLPLTLFGGARLEWAPVPAVVFEAPLVAGFKAAAGLETAGATLSPTLKLRPFGHASEEESGLNLFVFDTYGDSTYNALYYGVEGRDALPDRPRYSARAGQVSRNYGVSGGFYRGRWFFGGGYVHHDMAGSAARDSPLVVAPQSRSFGAFIRYNLMESGTLVRTW